MKKFQFKLAPVLKQRQLKEEAALRVLGAAQRAYQQELAVKAKLLSDLDRALRRREQLGKDPIGVDAFRLETDFIVGTKQRIVQQDQAILRAGKQVNKALRAYLETKKALRMIEMLREKAFAEYKRERAKYEQKQLDEIVTMRNRLREDASGSEGVAS